MDYLKIHQETEQRIIDGLEQILSNTSEMNDFQKKAYKDSDFRLKLLSAYMEKILTVTSCAAISSYHKQLRTKLLDEIGVDIGDML